MASLAGIIAVTSLEKLSMDQRRKMRDIDRKLGELIFGRLNFSSDLDTLIIDVFVEKLMQENILRKISVWEKN